MENEAVIPVVGMGATKVSGSDRYPYTIVHVEDRRNIVVQADGYRRTDNNGLSEDQEYEYTQNPDAAPILLTLRKSGIWRMIRTARGAYFVIGSRRAYRDPSF